MPYLLHGRFDSKEENREMLIIDIHFILLASAFSTPFAKLFEMDIFLKWYKR
jgi:hypothetical protein